MKDLFPILNSKPIEFIPLRIIKPHEEQAIINHSQDLETLAKRGGLSWNETLFVLTDEQYDYKKQIPEMDARTVVLQIVDLQEALENIIDREKRDAEKITYEVIINGTSTENMNRDEIDKYIEILKSISNKKWIESL